MVSLKGLEGKRILLCAFSSLLNTVGPDPEAGSKLSEPSLPT